MSIVVGAKNKAMELSRDAKLRHFYSIFKEGETVLDVGVSSESGNGPPTRNYFLKNYRYDPGTYTALGVQDLSGMEGLFPGKRFVQYPGGAFPFADNEFDWVFSNAVIEHVGDSEAQLLFVNEMMRVCRNVFFTTPNKYFPVESHTNIFFLHWIDGLFYGWCKLRKPWVNRNSLNLLSFRRLRKLMEQSSVSSFSMRRNLFLGIPMTFTVLCPAEDKKSRSKR